ncbi:MAG: Cof-type HAD-IIB family hydrolase [Oscillospiraceae bacterium]|nr:Cof-type HAD-IIB family hydrolase [Oscillospiraceae bacterium]
MVRMLVADLDNTLLRNDKTLSGYTADVFRRCREQGIKTALATARSEKGCARFLRQIQPDIFIGYGGAMVFAGEAVLRRFTMPPEVCRDLIRVCLDTPEVRFVFAISEEAALTNDPDMPFQPDYGHYRLSDFSGDAAAQPFLKVSVLSESPGSVGRIAARFPRLDLARYTGEPLYRFASPDAVKWNALKAAAAHCGIRPEEIVSFGDDVIDLEMLRECGTGVAVSNATAQVRAAADWICGSNEEDGVAQWIEEHVL